MNNSEIRLKLDGNRICTLSGKKLMLRGVGAGGCLNMENFITGYPATESLHREAIKKELGEEKYSILFDSIISNFFGKEDAEFLASNNMNLVRIPVNYRQLESDADPFSYLEEGFRRLDRIIDACADAGVYTVIDLHSVQGFQNPSWHSDNPSHIMLLWSQKQFQDRAVELWRVIARRYRENPWIAGYNPINEPADPDGKTLPALYRRMIEAIHSEDSGRIIFLDGNNYSREFDIFPEPWPDVVYTNHDYSLAGFVDAGPYPGESRGEYIDKKVNRDMFLRRSEFMLKNNLPIWVGEFGPVYTGDPEKDKMRYQVLNDQLENYDEFDVHWSVWTWKDVGLQGLCYTKEDSPWLKTIRPVLEKKKRLGADSWGSRDTDVRYILEPLENLFKKEFKYYNPHPFGTKSRIHRLVRFILLSEALVPEFASLFRGMDAAQLKILGESFAFKNCAVRQLLVEILAEHGCG